MSNGLIVPIHLLTNSYLQTSVSDNLALSLFMCFCGVWPLTSRYFWPLGILALFYSCLVGLPTSHVYSIQLLFIKLSVCILQARNSNQRGDIADGERSAQSAKIFNYAGIALQLFALYLDVITTMYNVQHGGRFS